MSNRTKLQFAKRRGQVEWSVYRGDRLLGYIDHHGTRRRLLFSVYLFSNLQVCELREIAEFMDKNINILKQKAASDE